MKKKRTPHPLAERDFERIKADGVPVDVVLATSMLQVGVDVSRFGLMVVTGQPKNTAEYIQASSRVGRSAEKPGLVVTLYNWSRPRDLAHYEDFEHYHATYYRQVEALSVTPYTRRALDRGTAATFVAAVRNVIEPYSRDADAQDVDLDGAVVEAVTERLLSRAEAASDLRGREYLAERIGALRDDWTDAKTGSTRLGYRKRTGKQPLNGLLDQAGGGAWTALTVPMSMRETENEVNLLVPGGACSTRHTASPPGRSPPGTTNPRDGPDDGDDVPDADELGESVAGRREAADAGDTAPAQGRHRAAQPPDVHRRRRRAHRPAELPRPRPRPRRLALRHRARMGAADRAQAAGRRRQAAQRPGHAAAAAAVAGRLRRRPERPGVAGRRAGHPVPAVAAVHRVQPARAAGLRQRGGS